MARLDVGRRIKHLLHARTTLRTFVGDNHYVATLYFTAQDAFASSFLRVKHLGRTCKLPDAFVHSGSLHYTTVLGDVTLQYGQSAILAISVLQVADATVGTVSIELFVISILRTQLQVELTAGGTGILFLCLLADVGTGDAVLVNLLGQRHAIYTFHTGIYQSSFGQFGHDGYDTTCTVHVLHVVFLRVRSNLTQAGRLARQHVNVFHLEVGSSLVGHGQQVKHRIGRTSHGYIQRHGVKESLASGDATGKYTLVAFLIVFVSVLYNQFGSVLEQFPTILVCSHNCSIARQSQSDGFVQTVHRIGGKHTRTASACGAGMLLYLGYILVAHRRIGRLDHGINQVEVLPFPLASLHRSARNEDGRNVQTHGGHQHARRNLVAVADADHGIGLVGIDHVLHTIGNDVARRQ